MLRYIDYIIKKKFFNSLWSQNAMKNSMEKLVKFPTDMLFVLDRYEGDYAVCENRISGNIIDIPRLMLDPYAKDGDILKWNNGIYRIERKK